MPRFHVESHDEPEDILRYRSGRSAVVGGRVFVDSGFEQWQKLRENCGDRADGDGRSYRCNARGSKNAIT